MIRLKREDVIKRFSIANEIYGKKSLFKLNDKEYNMNGVLFIGNKAFYTNNSFVLFAKTLDMPECEETQGNTMWLYNTPEEENPIIDASDINEVSVDEVPKKEKMTSLLSKDTVLTEEDCTEIENFWEKQIMRSFNTITTNKVIFRKTDLLGELQKLYGREKKNKSVESVAIKIDREANLLRMKPFRHKKKDEKREQKILDTIPGGELIIPFFEDDFLKRYAINDDIEKGVVLRVQELELIKVFQENEFISMSFNLMAFDPKERNKNIKEYTSKDYHIVFFKGYGGEDSSIRLLLPQITSNYNPMDI